MSTINRNYQDNTHAAANPAASSKQTLPLAKSVDTQSTLKMLQSEPMSLMMSDDRGISAFPEKETIFSWKGTIQGSKDTIFEGTEYNFPSTSRPITPSSIRK
ncbi:hypothetical protein Droror1_Dr00001631 [Drosera rotundifolia]